MKLHDHEATPRGRAFLWGGIALGLILMLVLVTKGFGLLAGGGTPASDQPSLVRQGEKIVIPEHSRLRERLTIAPARRSH